MRTLHTAVAAVTIALSAGACAPAGNAFSEDGPSPRRQSATVRVTNNNWANMTVYAVRGTSRFRLGMVTSMRTEVFRIPRAVTGGASGLRLLADPIGSSQTYLTPTVYVREGERVDFDIQNHLAISSVSVWGSRR